MVEETVIKTTKLNKEIKSLEELEKEGWTDNYSSFAPYLKIYSNGNQRLIYNTNNNTIEHRYSEKRK